VARARTDIGEITNDLMDDLSTIRKLLDLSDPAISDAWAGIETFAAISLRIMAKTNPSKVRSIAVTTAISTYIPPAMPARSD